MASHPRWESDQVWMPLQAADMLVSTIRRNADEFTADQESRDLQRQIIHGPYIEHDLTREAMFSMAAKADAAMAMIASDGVFVFRRYELP
jgi:hypothetical protein